MITYKLQRQGETHRERYMYIRKIERDKDTDIKKEERRDRGTGRENRVEHMFSIGRTITTLKHHDYLNNAMARSLCTRISHKLYMHGITATGKRRERVSNRQMQ